VQFLLDHALAAYHYTPYCLPVVPQITYHIHCCHPNSLLLVFVSTSDVTHNVLLSDHGTHFEIVAGLEHDSQPTHRNPQSAKDYSVYCIVKRTMEQRNHNRTRNLLQKQQRRHSKEYQQYSLRAQQVAKTTTFSTLLLLLLLDFICVDQHRQPIFILLSYALVGPHQILKYHSQHHIRGNVFVVENPSTGMAQPSLRQRFINTKTKMKDNQHDENDALLHERHSIIGGDESTTYDGNDLSATSATPTNSHTNIEKNLIVKGTKQLQQENEQLKHTIQKLQTENRILHQKVSNNQQAAQHQAPPIVVLERFEGEGKTLTSMNNINSQNDLSLRKLEKNSNENRSKIDVENGKNESSVTDMWCDTTTADGDMCPVEPNIQFTEALRDRAVWLVSLLILQSISGIILLKNEMVLANHPSSKFIFFSLSFYIRSSINKIQLLLPVTALLILFLFPKNQRYKN
jgi:hypothetical protein